MILQKNPLTMAGTLDRCWLFTFQSPPEWAEAMLPDALAPVTHNGRAFWNVVVCHVSRMRPKGFPKVLGVSYWHVAYRIYARYQPPGETPIEGLYFLRSDCDSRPMTALGNLMTDFRFHASGIRIRFERNLRTIEIDGADVWARASIRDEAPRALPEHSAFDTLEEADAFLKYKPYGISVDRRGRVNVVSIERDEAAWNSRLVTVEKQNWTFFDDIPARPEICYEVAPIDYQWNRGHVYPAAKTVSRARELDETQELWHHGKRLV